MGNWIVDNIRSEPLKWLPIGVSLLALLIGSMGWWEAHRSRSLNEAVNRPVLMIENNGKTQPQSDGQIDMHVWVYTKVQNLGKSTAVIDKFDYTFKFFTKCAIKEQPREKIEGTEILPTLTMRFAQGFVVLPGCNNKDFGYAIQGTVSYIDAGSGRQYSQSFSDLFETTANNEASNPSP